MPALYPVLLDLTRWTVVIIGGGAVAARKARGALEAGAARVRCVAPEFCADLPPEVERVPHQYRPEHLDRADLVFAATDQADVNEAVVRDAHARKLLVNRADVDAEEPGDFTVPAQLRRGAAVITVSAGSPALAAFIRDQLNDQFDPRWQQMADAMQQLRPLIRSAGVEISQRRQIFRELASEEALIVLANRGSDGLADWLLERHPELRHA